MRKKSPILLLSLLCSCYFNAQAQERRALVVGINTYSAPVNVNTTPNPRGIIKDLKGAVNDARAMQAILINRFQFKTDRIDTLMNREANREGILNGLKKLLDESKSRDLAVFYYAGHGSQVRNSLSNETDQKDETIVPADAWKPGVKDIRDKELATIYNQFLDKGVQLTVIMDCCHSGSLSRGPQPAPVYRYVEDADYDAKDASQPTPPETRPEGNFLILSAAQADELAQEQPSPDLIPHGAFTLALSQALELLSPNASCLQLFTTSRAILKSNGKKQEPVMGGSLPRQQQTLLGLNKGAVPDRSQIALLDDPKNPMSRKRVLLQGGFAVGLRKENELIKLNGSDTLVHLLVDTVLGPNRSQARFLKGTWSDLQAGEMLTVCNWVSSQGPLIRIYVPANTTDKNYTEWINTGKQLKKMGTGSWITELDKVDPEQSIYAEADGFRLNAQGKRTSLGINPSAAQITKLLKPKQSIYWEIPPSPAIANALREMIQIRKNPNIELVDKPEQATYWLVGNLNEKDQLTYRLRRAEVSSSDSLGNLPLITRSIAIPSNDPKYVSAVVDTLYEFTQQLARIRGWLQLASPINESSEFPYDLVLRNKSTQQPITSESYRIGERIQLTLEVNDQYQRSSVKKRFVYLFMIDRNGAMQLLYPSPNGGNVDNQFPQYTNGNLNRSTYLVGGAVEGPIGTDTYYLLATDEEIPNYATIFQQGGVRAVTGKFPLKNILMTGMEGSTRNVSKTATNWSLIRRSMTTNR